MIVLGAVLGTIVYLAATGNIGMLTGKGPGKGLAEGKAVANPMMDVGGFRARRTVFTWDVNEQGRSRVTV